MSWHATGNCPYRRTRQPFVFRPGASALHTDHLLDVVHDFHQVGLPGYHVGDVLVRPGDLVAHAAVLPAFHPGRLLGQFRLGERPLGLVARHAPAGTVRRRAHRVLVAEAADDVGAGSHRARDDPHVARACPDRALAGDQHLPAVVGFLGDVVVVAGDRLVPGDGLAAE